jgi:hypothetical protein
MAVAGVDRGIDRDVVTCPVRLPEASSTHGFTKKGARRRLIVAVNVAV